MDRFDMKSYLKFIIFVLKMIGLWPDNLEYHYNFYTFYLIFYFICVYIGLVIPQVIQLFLVVNNLEAFANCLFLTITVIGGTNKMRLFVKHLPRIKFIMDTLDNKLYQPKNRQQKLIMHELFKTWSYIFWFMFISANLTMLLLIIFPLIDRQLPSLAWYPFDCNKSPNYQLIFVNQILWLQYIALVNVHMDGLFSAIMIYVASECEFLCDNLRNIYDFTKNRLIETGASFDDDFQENDLVEDAVSEEYTNSLRIFVEHHRGILTITDETNTVFNYTVAFQFCASILGICMTMFRLSIVEPLTTEFCVLIFYQVALFWEILLYCWAGNEATYSSTKIPTAAFESAWIRASLHFRKDLVFFIRKTQEPIRFYALRFFILSLETFINILRTSWSYFALLRQVNEGPQ